MQPGLPRGGWTGHGDGGPMREGGKEGERQTDRERLLFLEGVRVQNAGIWEAAPVLRGGAGPGLAVPRAGSLKAGPAASRPPALSSSPRSSGHPHGQHHALRDRKGGGSPRTAGRALALLAVPGTVHL